MHPEKCGCPGWGVSSHLSLQNPLPTTERQVESLIEREYLERGQADRRVYNYLA